MMEQDTIVKYGEDILRSRAAKIEEFNDEIRELIPRMYKILVEARGLGLAGPQIGIAKRIFVYDVGEGKHALINPEIVGESGEEWGIEGCLSIPASRVMCCARSGAVTGITRGKKSDQGRRHPRVFQHEMDHLTAP